MPHIRTNRKQQTAWDQFWKATRRRRALRSLNEKRPYTLTNNGIQICLLLDYYEEKRKEKAQ